MAKPSGVSKFFKTLLTILLILIIFSAFGINILFMKPQIIPFNTIFIMEQTNMNAVQYGDAVISSASKVSELQPGNVVLCSTSFDNEQREILKLIDIVAENGTTYYYVKSDQDTIDDALKLTEDKILAKCLWTNTNLGKAITFAKSTMGIILLVALPCVILLILTISSTIAQSKEAKKEEELRKNLSKKKKKKVTSQNTSQIDTNNNTSQQTETPKETPKKPLDADEFFKDNTPSHKNVTSTDTKANIKPIQVKTLSEEESIKQRENASNIVGSELKRDMSSKTREFQSLDLNSEKFKNNMDDFNDDFEDDVHSPNMNEKANKIRKALSDNQITDNDTKPVIAIIPNDKPSNEQPKPTETNETSNINLAKDVENAVVIMPTETTPKATEDTQKDSKTSIENSFNEDDFLKDIIGDNDNISSSNSNKNKVSDDILDQLLNSIPSTMPKTEDVKKTTTTTTRKTTQKSERHSNNIKHHNIKAKSKATDSTSFDELIKAIEKEKNGIK